MAILAVLVILAVWAVVAVLDLLSVFGFLIHSIDFPYLEKGMISQASLVSIFDHRQTTSTITELFASTHVEATLWACLITDPE